MYSKSVIIRNQVGLHARYATIFVEKAQEFSCKIQIEKDGCQRDAKGLLAVLSVGVIGGNEIRIIAEGTDEVSAVNSLVELIETFGSDDKNDGWG